MVGAASWTGQAVCLGCSLIPLGKFVVAFKHEYSVVRSFFLLAWFHCFQAGSTLLARGNDICVREYKAREHILFCRFFGTVDKLKEMKSVE